MGKPTERLRILLDSESSGLQTRNGCHDLDGFPGAEKTPWSSVRRDIT